MRMKMTTMSQNLTILKFLALDVQNWEKLQKF